MTHMQQMAALNTMADALMSPGTDVWLRPDLVETVQCFIRGPEMTGYIIVRLGSQYFVRCDIFEAVAP